ncbi:uncharacterized protein LOC110008041 [Amborella trichopoda]|uniref:uncharacterized protein LOC110008041 n=1 Tax=Amborella trichopoda TaxID=13333 RepID=UPI0009C11567|nr:uncharacterized protein LOC110008041 [Amborella trichopoda]|eukprot:XP_020528754.1 uncharacterized protein LOC110008041 [Amborella trichopoda]
MNFFPLHLSLQCIISHLLLPFLCFSTVRMAPSITFLQPNVGQKTLPLSTQLILPPKKFNFQPHCRPVTLNFSHGMVCFQASDSLDFFVGNPATGRCTFLLRHGEIFGAMATGFYFDPISLNFKIFALGIFEVKMVCIGAIFYILIGDTLVAFDVERETREEISTPENINRLSSEVQLWNGQVSFTHINGELKLKMWVLHEEKNWIQMIEVDLQSMKRIENRSSRLKMMRPLLLFGDTFFISLLFEEEKNIIAFNVKNGSERLIRDGYPTRSAIIFDTHRPTLLWCEPFRP